MGSILMNDRHGKMQNILRYSVIDHNWIHCLWSCMQNPHDFEFITTTCKQVVGFKKKKETNSAKKMEFLNNSDTIDSSKVERSEALQMFNVNIFAIFYLSLRTRIFFRKPLLAVPS